MSVTHEDLPAGAAPTVEVAPHRGLRSEQFESSVTEQLQEMVIGSANVSDFLLLLCEYSAALTADGGEAALDCAVTLFRRRRAMAGMGNTDRARELNEIQQNLGQGPCLAALEQERTFVVPEALTDPRWPEFGQELVRRGIRSVLALPLTLDEGAAASIAFFSEDPDFFSADRVANAQKYAQHVQSALRLAVRLGVKQQRAEDLQDAMQARTTIDLAVGVIMGQQRCSQAAAFELLSRAASARNQKVRNVAQEMLENLSNKSVVTHFQE